VQSVIGNKKNPNGPKCVVHQRTGLTSIQLCWWVTLFCGFKKIELTWWQQASFSQPVNIVQNGESKMIYKATNKNQNAAYGSSDALIARPFAWR